MAGKTYLNFILVLDKVGPWYRARVLNSPAGQGQCAFHFPFSRTELETFYLKIGQSRHKLRRVNTPAMELLKDYGSRLFQRVFGGKVYDLFLHSSDLARQAGKGLRLQLRIQDPRLARLPWEYMYNPALNRFLSQGSDTPLVRYLSFPEAVSPQPAALPLKILVVIADPIGLPELDVEGEWRRLRQSLNPAARRGLVQVIRLEKPTLEALQDKLRSAAPFHVLHFIGHGLFNESAQDGALIFESENGSSQEVDGQKLGVILHNHPSLRLVVLNACEGGRSGMDDVFAGVAQSLLQQGIPAVVAMQFAITDTAALIFTREFYAALADGYPLDAALAEARVAIFTAGNDLEWGTPVLLTRSADGRIFDFEAGFEGTAPPSLEQATFPEQAGTYRIDAWQRMAAILGILVLLAASAWLLPSLTFHSPEGTLPASSPTSSPSLHPTQTIRSPTQIPSPTLPATHRPTSPVPGPFTPTPSPSSEATAWLESTLTSTLSLTPGVPGITPIPPTKTSTPFGTPTLTSTPLPILPYQVKQRILQEAALALSSHVEKSTLEALFWQDAHVFNPTTGQRWSYLEFYQQPHLALNENRHENLTIVSASAAQIVLRSDNCRVEKKPGKAETFAGNMLGTRWTFENRGDIWKIADLWIEDAPPDEVNYRFEDGTLGCWRQSSEMGTLLASGLNNSTARSHQGSHALALVLDLDPAPGGGAAQMVHDTSLPVVHIQGLSAWVYLLPENQPVALQARFILQRADGTWSTSQAQVLLPNTWTLLEGIEFSPELDKAGIQLIGIEISLPEGSGSASFQGTAYLDQVLVENEP